MAPLLSCVLAVLPWLASAVLSPSARRQFTNVYTDFGTNLGEAVPSRLTHLLALTGAAVSTYHPDLQLDSASLVLSFGNSSLSTAHLGSLAEVTSEGFKLVSQKFTGDSVLISSNGLPMNNIGFDFALDEDRIHYGAAVAAYETLNMLGFGFLHPLQAVVPSKLELKAEDAHRTAVENPFWPKRTWHVHTMHPLEFTEVFNGFDIPMFSKESKCPANAFCESWDKMFSELDGLFEWLLANRQNRVEVLLLGNKKWDMWNDLSSGSMRQSRLKSINQRAHDFGILMGADIPIALMQQHGWAMISMHDSIETQRADIEERVDWAFAAEYDFITTEAGLSEFTKPSCDLMLDLFNVFAKRVAEKWKRECLTKVHCSTSQFCTETTDSGEPKYPDPRTGEPINFNFLPTYAHSALGVLPHTVQVYSFEDPTAGAYGNENFSYMFDFMMFEASLGNRDVRYYGETAYWVNVDVDVPLFLPLIGQRRLTDLRKIAGEQLKSGLTIQGQMNFESGWEFGYHLSNAVTARSVWNPLINIDDEWEAYRATLRPLLNIFGDFVGVVEDAIVDLAKVQAEVMVHGRVDGKDPSDLQKLSGHAYMSGSDTWVDLPRMLGLSLTQPDKIHLEETDDPLWSEMIGILNELESVFRDSRTKFEAILKSASKSMESNALTVLEEIVDSVKLLHLRASHERVLYSAMTLNDDDRQRQLLHGRQILHEAEDIMNLRAAGFRVPEERVAGWRQGPTVYPYGYIWASRSLYFWWRDQGVAESRSLMSTSPCYLNRIEPIELVLGWGKLAEELLRLKLKKIGFDSNETTAAELLADCFAPPLKEIKFPHDL